jgi:hypothetical protein
MMSRPETPRLLALNVRAGRVGYAVFEGPKCLLDWGTRAIPSDRLQKMRDKRSLITSLIGSCDPSVIAVYQARRKGDVDSRRMQMIIKLVAMEASSRSIPVVSTHAAEIRNAFRMFRATNKYEMAAAAAGVYPEIFWKLPPSRKQWESEPRAMLVFDAIAAGFTYWQQHGCQMQASDTPASSFETA